MTEPNHAATERLIALVKRELRADEVELLAASSARAESAHVVVATLPDGRQVAAVFARPPDDRDALARRLGVIVTTFGQTLDDEGSSRPSRPPPVALSLHDELRALATRSRAIDAVVVDAHSPVVWGSALERAPWRTVPSTPDLADALEALHLRREELAHAMTGELELPAGFAEAGATREQDVVPERDTLPPVPSAEDDPEERRDFSRRMIAEVRALPAVDGVRRGRPFRLAECGTDGGWVAHSFAGIYLVVLVFDGAFDELRAQRAMHDALPRIERLVVALPPFDPDPEPGAAAAGRPAGGRGAVISLRGRRR